MKGIRVFNAEKESFVEFCRLACPKYAKSVAESTLKHLGTNIRISYDIDLHELLRQAKNFFSKNPNGVSIEADLPREIRGRNLNDTDYKKLVSGLVRSTTGFYVPATSLVPGAFYDALIEGCMISLNRNPLFRGLDRIVGLPLAKR